jgi:hypothetical protein
VDLLWATIAEYGWVVPVAAGAGVFAMLGMRRQRVVDARRLEYDAARLELADARTRDWSARSTLKLAKAQLARAQAARATSQAGPAEVAAARKALQTAQRNVQATSADVRVRRMRVSAARAGLAATSDPAHRPLAMTLAAHDEITARWLAYETDPARLIAFPLMSDGRVPTTAAYLVARAEAQRLRPPSDRARITPVQFAAYRNAVEHAAHAFEAAEEAAWKDARANGMIPPEPAPEPVWVATAQQFLNRSTQALSWASENASTVAGLIADAAAARAAKTAAPPGTAKEPPRTADAEPAPTPSPAAPHPEPVWPVPSRTPNRSAS